MVINVSSVQYSGPSFNRPSICRRPDSHTCFFFLFSFCFFGDVAFPEYFVYHWRFLFVVWRVRTSFVLSFRMVLFYLVTTGWIFDIILLYENSDIKNSITMGSPILYCYPV